MTLPRTLFVGWNYDSVVSYYRCFLPAMALGADHLVWRGTEQGIELIGGLGDKPRADDLYNYEVVILQQPRGRVWLNVVRELQSKGIRVLSRKSYEVLGGIGTLFQSVDRSVSTGKAPEAPRSSAAVNTPRQVAMP